MRFLIALAVLAADGLSSADFEKLHRELLPKDAGGWAALPWETSLGEATQRAVREKKPLLLWARMGNPLVCT
jgi:hypothetical protein